MISTPTDRSDWHRSNANRRRRSKQQDWHLGTPDVRLTRVFAIVLILNIVAIAGLLAFRYMDTRSESENLQIEITPILEVQSTLN